MRRDGQKVLLAVKNMGGESEAAWRGILDDLTQRGLKAPELAIVDGARLRLDAPAQRRDLRGRRRHAGHLAIRTIDSGEMAGDALRWHSRSNRRDD